MQTSALQLILQAGVFVKGILFILAGFSIISWGIILYKYLYLRAASQASASFLNAFRAGGDTKDTLKAAGAYPLSPLVGVFKAASAPPGHGRPGRLDKSIRRQVTLEAERLHSHLTFLATTGSTSPFIGLLGTVWGIMDAFRGIGAAGSASLAVVAPAIAEALITTAAGLAAAIPAVIAYNAYVSWVRKMTIELEEFSEVLRDRLPTGAS